MCEKLLKCPICAGGGRRVHQGTRDNAEIDVYRCSECGTRFLSVIDREYDYENGFMHENGDLSLSYEEIAERLCACKADDMRRFNRLKDMCTHKHILDFGCGFGGFLQNISRVSTSCSGVELGKDERNYLKEKGITCYKSIDECEETFDVITMFHVFEHLTHPEQWLDKMSRYLKKDGKLIIEVPNGDDALLTLYGNEKFADFTYWSAHLFLYTIKSLSMIINQSGKYEILSAGQVQRYSLANHLMWLSKGLPGGHEKWKCMDSDQLNKAYAEKLEELKMCDTLFFVLRRK